MPYPNEHAARIHNPDKYKRIRRENDKFGKGIHAIWGVKDDNSVEVQAIRFDKTKFSPKECKKWLTDNDYSPVEFEPASEEESSKSNGDFSTTELLEYNAEQNQPLKFSFLAQTEGEYTGMSGKTLEYRLEHLEPAANTLIGATIKDDVTHSYARKEDERPFSTDFAQIIDAAIVQVNQEMVDKFKLNPALIGKHGIKVVAEAYDPVYSERIRRGLIKNFSTELQYEPKIDGNKIVPTNIKYKNVAAIRGKPADIGGFLLEVYNMKYGGGVNMPENTGTSPTAEERLKEVEKEKDTLSKALEEANVKLKEQSEAAAKDKESLAKSLAESNAKVDEYQTKERKQVIGELTSDEKLAQEILNMKLPDVEFNKEVAKLKAIKEEAYKAALEANKKKLKTTDAGTAPLGEESNTADDFRKEWGMSREEYFEKNLGVKIK